METTPSSIDETTITVADTGLDVKVTRPARASIPPPKLNILITSKELLSPISIAESVFSPTSSIRRSPSTLSICSSESPDLKLVDDFEIAIRSACLQCFVLGLRCSFTTIRFLGEYVGRSKTCCVRCARNGERFCVLRVMSSRNENKVDYCAEGVNRLEVNIRAEELFAPRKQAYRWCLPKIPPGTKLGLRPVGLRLEEAEAEG